MEDPVVGGYTPDKVALRRAIGYAYDQQREIDLVKQGQAIAAESPIGPEVEGYDPNYRNVFAHFDPAIGNALLDKFGYKDCDGDGYREQPGCKPLELTYLWQSNKDTRDQEELLLRTMNSLHIKLKIDKKTFSDLVKQRQAGQYMMSFGGWSQDYPDGENFMQLLYGPNAGPVNEARFKNAEFDKLYEQINSMPAGPERNAKFRRMSKIAAAWAPWLLSEHFTWVYVAQPWVRSYIPHPCGHESWLYYDIDLATRKRITGK
jgi:ABC-type transport system substrate-binding protein